MAYKDMTLSDMMETVRKQREKEERRQAENEARTVDEIFEDLDVVEEPQPLDLDRCIKEAMARLASCRLPEQDLQRIREFLTLHVRVKQSRGVRREARKAYYNLILYCDEKENIRRVADILRTALQIGQSNTLYITEKELIRKVNAGSTNRSVSEGNYAPIPYNTSFILIDECQDKPLLDMEGGGNSREISKKQIREYNNTWQTVINFVSRKLNTILVIGCEKSVYRNTIRPFAEISQVLCKHHIQLMPQTQEELMEDCIEELNSSAFELAEDFAPALENYFNSVYPIAEQRGQNFVKQLIGQIYSLYFSKKQDSQVLDASCVPQVDLLNQSVESILGRMDELVGLETVKAEFRNIYRMQVAGLLDRENTRYHMIFSGNPGTGKTTVARLTADLFYRMGIIRTNKLVMVKPCDMVSEWIGGTGTKAMDVIQRAYNGVLFVDEAYGFANMDRGNELLNILLQEMENNSHKLVVIFAGYTEEMRELLKANPGLGSRIGQELVFNDYSVEELTRIFLQMCKKDGFTLDPAAADELDDCIHALMTREFFGNARDVRNMLQDLKEVWSEDYYNAYIANGREEVDVEREFKPHHFVKIMPPKKEVSINDLIGLDVMKQKLEIFKKQVKYQKHLKEKGFGNVADFSMHMIFTGNPGTGKTTVAKLIADDLYSIGMLKTNRLVIAERKDLVGIYGDTAQRTADIIRKAVGGVLFIDEAYALSGNRNGSNECIEVLLTAMEEHKADTVFIFAGYVNEMQEFLASNPGIQSRIGYTFHFEDYTPENLTNMYQKKMKKMGFQIAEDAVEKVREIMEYFQAVKNFGNGRFVNHVIHQTISQRAIREFGKQYKDICAEDIPTIKTLIETAPNGMHLYDPAQISDSAHRRTAMHELGHAVVMLVADPENVPESISVRSNAGSFGRVRLHEEHENRTEQQMINHIAGLLGGKNAERVCFGTHATGCAGDYHWAKQTAQNMIDLYAMTGYGKTPEEILEAADKLSMDILTQKKDFLEAACPILMEKKEISGEDFKKMLGV